MGKQTTEQRTETEKGGTSKQVSRGQGREQVAEDREQEREDKQTGELWTDKDIQKKRGGHNKQVNRAERQKKKGGLQV